MKISKLNGKWWDKLINHNSKPPQSGQDKQINEDALAAQYPDYKHAPGRSGVCEGGGR
jgi:hypothetical protein